LFSASSEFNYWNIYTGNSALFNQKLMELISSSPSNQQSQPQMDVSSIKHNEQQSVNLITIDDQKEVGVYVWNKVTIVLVLRTFHFISPASTIYQITNAFDRIAKQYTIKNIILDLRTNGGGYIDMAFKLARYLAPSLPIVSWPLIDVSSGERKYL